MRTIIRAERVFGLCATSLVATSVCRSISFPERTSLMQDCDGDRYVYVWSVVTFTVFRLVRSPRCYSNICVYEISTKSLLYDRNVRSSARLHSSLSSNDWTLRVPPWTIDSCNRLSWKPYGHGPPTQTSLPAAIVYVYILLSFRLAIASQRSLAIISVWGLSLCYWLQYRTLLVCENSPPFLQCKTVFSHVVFFWLTVRSYLFDIWHYSRWHVIAWVRRLAASVILCLSSRQNPNGWKYKHQR